jgi:hypothetical protein
MTEIQNHNLKAQNGNADNYTNMSGTKKFIRGASQKFPDLPRGALNGSISPVRRCTPMI